MAELAHPRNENLSKDMLNGVSGIQIYGQKLCKPVISVHKVSKLKPLLLSTNESMKVVLTSKNISFY